MAQPWYVSHAETIAQNLIGLAVGFVILRFYGVETTIGLRIQATIFVCAYLRGYLIRRAFNRIKE